MPRYRNTSTGVVVNVPADKVGRLGSGYEPVDEPTKAEPAEKPVVSEPVEKPAPRRPTK